jgi:hypothetical protein
MKVIAHRANINGPNLKTENSYGAIGDCIKAGYDVEVDVLHVEGHLVFIGHDELVDDFSLRKESDWLPKIWFHAKNIETLLALMEKKLLHSYRYNIFMHDKDEAAITDTGFVWQYPTPKLIPDAKGRVICVMPEWSGDKFNRGLLETNHYYGVCTDFPQRFAEPYSKIKDMMNFVKTYDTMYGSLYLSLKKDNTYELMERIYATYDRPEYNVKYNKITEDQKDMLLSTKKIHVGI